ncbi:MAG: acyl carrier protein [Sphingobacteriia bacterium]|nr:acyl carrier protein [Sphingobacteriia bacterium]
MDKSQFLTDIKKIIETESDVITLDSKFEEIEEIDSLTIMSICSWLNDKHKLNIKYADFNKYITLSDLFNEIELQQKNA